MQQRQRALNNKDIGTGPVIYWMDRDQRPFDHWGLLCAQALAIELKQPLLTIFCFQKQDKQAAPAHDQFILQGLLETKAKLERLGIPFLFFYSPADKCLGQLAFMHETASWQQAADFQPAAVFCDFSPLRQDRVLREKLAKILPVALFEVDSHNIIPCWLASDKQAYAAYTFRPAVKRQLNAWLTDIPALIHHPFSLQKETLDQLSAALPNLVDPALCLNESAVNHAYPAAGSQAGNQHLSAFLASRIATYHERNDPNKRACSGLSPWLHFGQLSPQRAAYAAERLQREIRLTALNEHKEKMRFQVKGQEAQTATARLEENLNSFLEELIVRRELSDNFCFYNQAYDSPAAYPDWAITTLRQHRLDPRPYIYHEAQFEAAETEDPLWNAAQRSLTEKGFMHGYLRMYWAKKILEWTPDYELAHQIALSLNDRYALDGRDANGYTGIAWSIGGVHDRAWSERPVFGKIRYMSYNGSRRKFDVDQVIASMPVPWFDVSHDNQDE